jgi:hypothetical protein
MKISVCQNFLLSRLGRNQPLRPFRLRLVGEKKKVEYFLELPMQNLLLTHSRNR